MSDENENTTNFIHEEIEKDLASGRFTEVHTRFPPEPNGYLHIGHAKAIMINYTTAKKYGGKFNLRFDDTDPTKEKMEFVESLKRDIKWLGADWGDRLFFASDYFEQLYEWALKLIGDGKAYVDDLSADEIREYRGTLTQPGKNSPYRDRSIEENLDLFKRMKAGEFPEGSHTLRAKIDMAHPNINFRDPVMYRILFAEHYRRGTEWCIYPMYDWTHGQSDSLEGVTHSLCSLEFENNRPLYEWYIEQLGIFKSRQIEFARLNITYVVLSKRYFKPLLETGFLRGWDDPRMPTIAGMRRRGYTPEGITNFLEKVGVAKTNSMVDYALLEHSIREDLDARCPRAMAVLDPVKLVITNMDANQEYEFEVDYYRHDPEKSQTRKMILTNEVYIEREDFMVVPPQKFFRLAPGEEVRLMNACLVTCTDYKTDADGNVTEIHCTYDPESLGGNAPDGRRIKGTLHWVSTKYAVPAEVRLYDRLFKEEVPEDIKDVNPDSLEVLETIYLEPALGDAKEGDQYQFMRKGFFVVDPDSTTDKLVFNRTVSLRDSWAKIAAKG